MKDIKVGQWVRTKDNKFVKVYNNECYHCKKGIEYIVNSKDGITSVGCIPYENIILVADTPQELIRVGDMVRIFTILKQVIEIKRDDLYFYNDKWFYDKNEVIEIWTKTSANTYTRQWFKE